MAESEIMSIMIYYAAYSDDFKHFKAFYHHKYAELKDAFPRALGSHPVPTYSEFTFAFAIKKAKFRTWHMYQNYSNFLAHWQLKFFHLECHR